MKKIIFYVLLFVVLLMTSGCYYYYQYTYTYYREKNKKGVSKFIDGQTIFKNCKHPKGSYASDGKFVKKVDIIFLHDTISKRCFNSVELEKLKDFFKKDTLFSDVTFQIEAFNEIDLEKCIGLFYVRFIKGIGNNLFVNIPLIKLQDTIFVNGIFGVEVDDIPMDYIENSLLEVYDSLETIKRSNAFLKGKFYERINKGYPSYR